MKKIKWDFSNLDMAEYPEITVELAKGIIEDLINQVDLPVKDGWVMVTPEMLVLLILKVSSSVASIRK